MFKIEFNRKGKNDTAVITVDETVGTDARVAEIKKLCKKARKVDPKRECFGADGHKYKYGRKLSLFEVRKCEEKLGVTFPEELVEFYTKVGNGGAGDGYGIYPIGTLADRNEWLNRWQRHSMDESKYVTFSTMTDEEWADWYNAECDDDSAASVMGNILIIGTHGCTSDYGIVLHGPDKGKILSFFSDWEETDRPKICSDSLFDDIIEHLKYVISGEWKMD